MLPVVALLLSFAAAVRASPIPNSPTSALKIMPLGDSITQWHCGHQARVPADPRSEASFGGFRGPLFANLASEWGENAFTTVGGEYGCGSHEGHSGWTCEDLAGITKSATSYAPDVVLLMCGTNDLYYRPSTLKPEKGGNVTQVLGRMSALLAKLFAVRPNATVLLSTVPEINVSLACSNKPRVRVDAVHNASRRTLRCSDAQSTPLPPPHRPSLLHLSPLSLLCAMSPGHQVPLLRCWCLPAVYARRHCRSQRRTTRSRGCAAGGRGTARVPEGRERGRAVGRARLLDVGNPPKRGGLRQDGFLVPEKHPRPCDTARSTAQQQGHVTPPQQGLITATATMLPL